MGFRPEWTTNFQVWVLRYVSMPPTINQHLKSYGGRGSKTCMRAVAKKDLEHLVVKTPFYVSPFKAT